MKSLRTLLITALLTSPALAQDRFPEIPVARMTLEQKAIVDAIASSPRRSAAGPFNAWLRSPALVDRLQQVGQYVRFQSSLPPRLSEFVILVTSRRWNSKFEWDTHYPLALEAGTSVVPLGDLAAGRPPSGMDADEALVYAVLSELRETTQVSDATYAKAVAKFGERGIVDMITATGYYDIVCMTLNVAQVPAPAISHGPPLTVPATTGAH